MFKAGERSPVLTSSKDDDASPVYDTNTGIPEVSTLPVKEEIELKIPEDNEVLVEDPLSFTVGDFVVVKKSTLLCSKIIQFDEHKKLFTGDYLRKTQLHKSVQDIVAFKYPVSREQRQT